MTDTKKKAVVKPKVVRINNEGGDTDEVFLHLEDPYVNKVIYVKAGKYKVGDEVEEEG